MSAPPRRLVVLLAAAALAAAAVAGWYALRPPPPPPPPPPAGPPPVLPLSTSPYRNTGPDATYVGSAACVRCHVADHTSYQRTGMARSTSPADPKTEPADAAFTHAPSGRRYEVVRRDGRVRHRELRGDEAVSDFALAYAIGSGRHAKTYVVEDGGFLVESPVSWYRSRGWAPSPGYEGPAYPGFERSIANQCLFCHTGRHEIADESVNRGRIVEPAVSCERCHGPGSLHVAERAKGEPAPPRPEGDLTIVNPKRLPRELAEAVCQQCHLSAELAVPARGRTAADFRPGLPWQDVFHAFEPAGSGHAMTVTGHVEQLHQSACYQKSATLTCATCHNPHGFPEPARKVAHYRAACLACHAEAACKVEPERRRREAPGDDCAKCHMPTGGTDIPHVAFSHHRIGVHKPGAAPAANAAEELEPSHDLSRFDPLDRKRSLGLAHRRAAGHADGGPAAEGHSRRAYALLTEVWDAGLRDGPTAAALGALTNRLGAGDPLPFAEAALADPRLDGQDRSQALALIGNEALRARDYERAADQLRALTRLRRSSADWANLARVERALGRETESVRLMEEAARIGGAVPRVRAELADWYDRRGDRAAAEKHRRIAGAGR